MQTIPEYHPLSFADSVGIGEHIVLFHENQEYAQEIAFRFLWKGLKGGQSGVYATWDESQAARKSIIEYFPGAKRLLDEDLLRFVDLRRSASETHSSMIRRLASLAQNEKNGLHRIVFSFTSELNLAEQINLNAKVELETQKAFSQKKGGSAFSFLQPTKCSLMCVYDISHITPKLHGNWLIALIKSHDHAIFAPKPGNGIVLSVR